MRLLDVMNRFYYDMSLNELRLMNENTIYPHITYNSLLYLDLISYKRNCTVSYLAQAIQVSKSAVTIKVNELVNQGLVIKKQSDEDKRVYYLSISPLLEGKYKAYDARLNILVGVLQEKYREADLEKFCDMLEVVSTY